ncbi:hypothetical protein HANVADRAFT_888 [Hanseniaspora valbyensis NRRL Y-1626]|uniref:Uncharacterized protein n=1 Tax=Hanseniaspora valbyensis NRRL Y-1626 TaxID=766949 RepID=A0A1B7THQ1_9ASCO|nr:hypothetical protein HANVADRAFT_888 [Hanseniaspora valbyensis NRRL Y-1626]
MAQGKVSLNSNKKDKSKKYRVLKQNRQAKCFQKKVYTPKNNSNDKKTIFQINKKYTNNNILLTEKLIAGKVGHLELIKARQQQPKK